MTLSPARLLVLPALGLGCQDVRSSVTKHYPQSYTAEAVRAPVFDGLDAGRAQLSVGLQAVLSGLRQPTDVQFPPGRSDRMVVLGKEGVAVVADRASDGRWSVTGELLDLEVLTSSEQGLLGLAFAPTFPADPRVFVHYSVRSGSDDVGRVSAFTVQGAEGPDWRAVDEQVVLEQVQPYANHDAGQLAFGPDGMLYVGFGDGGWRDDPEGHGQDRSTWLGSMLRLDVSRLGPGYQVPADNPFVGQAGVRPETWASGLRNPWRYSFAPDGRLVVGDVGQNLFEEIDVVERGANLGWKVREGRHCFPPGEGPCDPAGLVDPVYEYGRDEGASVTGGVVYTGAAIPSLRGKYVFGDFVSGRIWAIDLPAQAGADAGAALALGKHGVLLSTFGQDAAGEIYVADYGEGSVYALVAR